MDPISTARYGIMAAERRFADSASRVARMAGDDSVDYGAEAVGQIQAKTAFSANVHVVKVADEMFQALLDLQSR
jgi:flagellar basal body rod protein FlgC